MLYGKFIFVLSSKFMKLYKKTDIKEIISKAQI